MLPAETDLDGKMYDIFVVNIRHTLSKLRSEHPKLGAAEGVPRRQAAPSAAAARRSGRPHVIRRGLRAARRGAAKSALDGFIAQRHEQLGFSNLLLLTAQLADLMTFNSGQPDMGDQDLVDVPFKLTITHSLHAMLAHSDLKREAWQHMTDLRARLRSA